MAVLTVAPAAQKYFDSDGITPLASGKVYTYSAGTTTPLATYSDAAGSTPNANPITLDANGQALIYVTAGTAYDFVIKRSDGTQVGVTQRVKADGGDSPAHGSCDILLRLRDWSRRMAYWSIHHANGE